MSEEEWTLNRISRLVDEMRGTLDCIDRLEATLGRMIATTARIGTRLRAMNPRLEAMHADVMARLTAMGQRRN